MSAATLALVEDPSSALSDPELLIFRLWLQGHSFGRAAELLCALELQRGEEAEADAVGIFLASEDQSGAAHDHNQEEEDADVATGRPLSAKPSSKRKTKTPTAHRSTGPSSFSVSRRLLTLFQHEVQNSYRTFGVFEALLEQPILLGLQSQIECPVDNAEQRQRLVALYYGFNPLVFREFMGLKLTSRLRSNLDDVSDRTGIPIRSVRRQFDNLKRIHSRFDDVAVFRGNVTSVCLREFCLPPRVAQRYAAASFLLFHRFDLETSERKYQFLTWGDCEYMALQLMSRWVTRPILLQHLNFFNNHLHHLDQQSVSYDSGSDQGFVRVETIFGDPQRMDDLTTRVEEAGRAPANAATTPGGSSHHPNSMLRGGGGGGQSGGLRAASVAVNIGEVNSVPGSVSDRIRRGSKSMDEVCVGGATNQIAAGVDAGVPGGAGGIRRLHSNWNTFGVNNKNLINASTDASGAQFALDRRGSMDLDPGWLSDLRLIKSQIQARASALDVLAQRVATVVNEAGSSFMATAGGSWRRGGGDGGGSGTPSDSAEGDSRASVSAHSTTAGGVAPSALMHASSAPTISLPVPSSSVSISSSESPSVFKRVTSKAAREIIRNMLTIAGNLSQAKELRDFFEDVMERVCDPLLQTMGMRSYVNHVASRQQVGRVAGINNDGGAGRGAGLGNRAGPANSHIHIQTSALDLLRGETGHQSVSSSKPAVSVSAGNAHHSVVSDPEMCVACARAFFRSTFDATGEVYQVKSLEVRRRERLLASWRMYLDVVACCAIRMMRRRLGMLRSS